MEEKKYLTKEERKKLLKELGERTDFIGGLGFDPEELFCPECGGRLESTWCTKCDKLFKYDECIKKKK